MSDASVKTLQQIKTLSSYSLSELEKLAANMAIKHVKKNEMIFNQDEEAKLVYLLVSGVVRVSYINSQQKEIIVSLIPAGEVFGTDALTPKTRHPFRCDAFENCTVGSIRPQIFVETLLGIPYELFLRWQATTMDSGRRMYVHCIKGLGLDLRRRLALELMNLADRFGVENSSGLVIHLTVSHEVLAGLVGASRQQVTEYLNEFDRENIISRDGRRIIIDVPRLQRIILS